MSSSNENQHGEMGAENFQTKRFSKLSGFCLERDGPDADLSVGVPSVEGVAVVGPREGNRVRDESLLGAGGELGAELRDNLLALKIPDLDLVLSGGAEPVAVGGEHQGVDGVSSVERVEVLALVEVPEHGSGVLASGGAEGTVRGDSDGVDVSLVPGEGVLQLAGGQVPDLDDLVPSSGDDQGVGRGGGELDARDPVSVGVVLDGELALSQGVPELDHLVPGS
mmetsp:Transcript_6445/g.9672  ORF Transcript_6445/g.9672 Transcript_6445/m.9672 type:complete len:223 (+) Transcript_6445:42-710(+)